MEGYSIVVPEFSLTPISSRKDHRRLEEPDSSLRFLFHSQVDGQTRIDYTDLEEIEILCLNGRILKQTFMFGWVDSLKDEVIDEEDHFCWTHLSFRYLMIRFFEWYRLSISNSVLCSLRLCWITILIWELWWIVEEMILLTTCFIWCLLNSATLSIRSVSLFSNP